MTEATEEDSTFKFGVLGVVSLESPRDTSSASRGLVLLRPPAGKLFMKLASALEPDEIRKYSKNPVQS